MTSLQPGAKGTARWTVTENMTAESCGSGSLRVLATPMLCALMESAACNALKGLLPKGSTSVGTEINLRHTAPTPVGSEISAEAVLTGAEGRALTFEITARDQRGLIGTALHRRAVVDVQRFMGKLEGK